VCYPRRQTHASPWCFNLTIRLGDGIGRARIVGLREPYVLSPLHHFAAAQCLRRSRPHCIPSLGTHTLLGCLAPRGKIGATPDLDGGQAHAARFWSRGQQAWWLPTWRASQGHQNLSRL
jgi:hypothetical protein